MLISLVPGLILVSLTPDAVVAIVDEGVDGRPVVRQLHADDDIGIGRSAHRRGPSG